MGTEDPWRAVLIEAIGKHSNEPIIGTHFRATVHAVALNHGLEFPPKSEPDLKFIQLLQRYPDVISVRRRLGQDFLVVPAGRSDLLTQVLHGRLFGIRRDFFEAFTMVSDAPHYYDKAADRIIWRKPDGTAIPDSWVQMDPTTLEGEVKLRQDFVASLPSESGACPVLTNALKDTQPLQSFGRTVREVGVQREWHTFRTEKLTERMQRWAQEKGIEWKDAWLTEAPWAERSSKEAGAGQSSRTVDDPLRVLFGGLDAADIQRISIPLDLVLKAIASSKKTS